MKQIVAIIFALFSFAVGFANQQDTTVYLINAYPGSEIYQLEGHSGIAIEFPNQRAVVVNYGVFDFNSPGFAYRFVSGQTDYMAVSEYLELFLMQYVNHGRRVVAHKLNLSPEQTRKVVDYLKWNVKPENCVYRYNYVKDNCATRPLNVIEQAVGDTIVFETAPFERLGRKMTYRNIMRHYHANYPWYQFSIDLALGCGVDYPLTTREAAFAPTELDGMLPTATIAGNPLVAESIVIVDTPADAAIEPPTPWILSPLTICWIFFLLALWVTFRDIRRKRLSKWFDAVFFSIIGIAGCFLSFLIFVSSHEATSPNYLLIWLNPLAFIVPIFIWLKFGKNIILYYQICNFVVLIVAIAFWWLIPQSGNAAFIPLLLAELMRSAIMIRHYSACAKASKTLKK